MGFAECSFVALATKDNDLIAEMIIGHSEVVTSALADLVSRNETTLNYWNPDVIHDVEHDHVIEAVALCVKTAVDEKVFWKGSIMCTNKNRLMAVPWRRLLSVHWHYLPHALHSLHAYLYLSIGLILSLSDPWHIGIIGVSSNLDELLFDLDFLLDDN